MKNATIILVGLLFTLTVKAQTISFNHLQGNLEGPNIVSFNESGIIQSNYRLIHNFSKLNIQGSFWSAGQPPPSWETLMSITGYHVGIGTETPDEKLTVDGNIKATGSGEVYANKVGIGTSSPSDPMHVRGILRLQGHNPSSVPGNYWRIYHNANATSDQGLQFRYNNGLRARFLNDEFQFDGLIKATEVKVQANVWSDFVFEAHYQLPTLQEVEAYIREHGHLKDIPSTKEVEESGINLAEMNAKLLQKIEELTLYVIDQEKRMKQQEEKILELERKVNN